MDRRSFLASLMGVAAGAAALSVAGVAHAASAPVQPVAPSADVPNADLPAEGAEDAQYYVVRRRRYYRPRRARYYYRPRRVRYVYRRPVYRRRVRYYRW